MARTAPEEQSIVVATFSFDEIESQISSVADIHRLTADDLCRMLDVPQSMAYLEALFIPGDHADKCHEATEQFRSKILQAEKGSPLFSTYLDQCMFAHGFAGLSYRLRNLHVDVRAFRENFQHRSMRNGHGVTVDLSVFKPTSSTFVNNLAKLWLGVKVRNRLVAQRDLTFDKKPLTYFYRSTSIKQPFDGLQDSVQHYPTRLMHGLGRAFLSLTTYPLTYCLGHAAISVAVSPQHQMSNHENICLKIPFTSETIDYHPASWEGETLRSVDDYPYRYIKLDSIQLNPDDVILLSQHVAEYTRSPRYLKYQSPIHVVSYLFKDLDIVSRTDGTRRVFETNGTEYSASKFKAAFGFHPIPEPNEFHLVEDLEVYVSSFASCNRGDAMKITQREIDLLMPEEPPSGTFAIK